jgi:hypothetical protein
MKLCFVSVNGPRKLTLWMSLVLKYLNTMTANQLIFPKCFLIKYKNCKIENIKKKKREKIKDTE